MKEVVRKEIVYDLNKLTNFLRCWPKCNLEELKSLSDHSIEDVALHKNIDIISVTVLIYSLYKLLPTLTTNQTVNDLLTQLDKAYNSINSRDLGKYNSYMKISFQIVKDSHGEVREHLQDVLHAARIKKGTALLEHGLSIGQAAGLMGLSNWDLQDYASKTVALGVNSTLPIEKRLKSAFQIFKV